MVTFTSLMCIEAIIIINRGLINWSQPFNWLWLWLIPLALVFVIPDKLSQPPHPLTLLLLLLQQSGILHVSNLL